MKRNIVTLIIGGLLVLIFVVLLFTFQVRQTEVAVVTTFDKPTDYILDKPGLKFKWPRPIQKVYLFDKRINNFEGRFEQALTRDGYNLLVMVYVGWTIKDPRAFFNSFPGGKAQEAEPALSGLIESGKNEVVGKHPFSHFVSTEEKELKFVEVENEILQAIRPVAESKYGVDIRFVGIKKLGLPESVTEKVFARMQAERDRKVQELKAEGEAKATEIKSLADRDRAVIIAKATAVAEGIRGQADAESAQWFSVFSQAPDLALLLQRLKVLEETLKEKSTLILDERTPPFDLLTKQPSASAPAASAHTLGGGPSGGPGSPK